ncbi:MFS transporter [Pseudaquabacterium pictum]|jgi:predicted MFS family arabinose efflux permease|uniref:MFS transporter n=1 Tax=Pseudaquabacterium pictum TaxID=2315236 RepID=A0A480AV95_9BURK|nr:MFS transporter [Rubrivivax pictus]GCL65619.1 MFS transporter [Rubrivivax pictus]
MLKRRSGTVAALGTAQTLAWASTYYLPAILAAPMARELGVSTPTVFAAFSGALIVSAFVGPRAGAAIDRHGGRPVLMLTSIVFALGLAGLGLARDVVGLFAAWVVLGIGMGSGLYEAAFASLVRLYGKDARSSITAITLIAGFASTVGWPLSAVLEAEYGWRAACFTWAALHLVLGLPLNALLPIARKAAPTATDAPMEVGTHLSPSSAPESQMPTVVLSFVFAATWFISTSMAAHLPQLMLAAGATVATAILVGSLIGPSQVAARLLEFGLLRRVHPLLSARLAAAAHPLGVALLLIAGPVAAPLFGVLHGAGNGILTIAKGTLPLVIFGPQGYGLRQGLLMVPARVAQALAPWLFGMALDVWGTGALAVSGGLGLAALLALLALRGS